MRNKKCGFILCLGVFFALIIGITSFVNSNKLNTILTSKGAEGPVDSLASNNPASPIAIDPYTSYSEAIQAPDSYYYKTKSPASPGYYQLFWVRPVDMADDYFIHLYNDSGFTDPPLISSELGSGELNWVLFRPTSTQFLYSKVNTSDTGAWRTEWENGTAKILVDDYIQNSSSAALCIDMWNVYLQAGTAYNFSLEISGGPSCDLFLYYLNNGTVGNSTTYIECSTNVADINEEISNYTAPVTDYYALLVVNRASAGDYILRVNYTTPPPQIPPNLTIKTNNTNLFVDQAIQLTLTCQSGSENVSTLWFENPLGSGNETIDTNFAGNRTYYLNFTSPITGNYTFHFWVNSSSGLITHESIIITWNEQIPSGIPAFEFGFIVLIFTFGVLFMAYFKNLRKPLKIIENSFFSGSLPSL